jgi:hypothetical protein
MESHSSYEFTCPCSHGRRQEHARNACSASDLKGRFKPFVTIVLKIACFGIGPAIFVRTSGPSIRLGSTIGETARSSTAFHVPGGQRFSSVSPQAVAVRTRDGAQRSNMDAYARAWPRRAARRARSYERDESSRCDPLVRCRGYSGAS